MLPEEQNLVLSTHISWLKNSCNYSSRGPDALLWLLQSAALMSTLVHAYTYINKINHL